MKITQINVCIVFTSILGILVSTYGLYVSLKSESNPRYKALCDISDNMSCSKVLTSRFSRGLALLDIDYLKASNTVYGILFYCAVILLTNFEQSKAVQMQLGLAIMSFFTCFYLPYCILYILNQFCIVSFTIYVIKVVILIFVYAKYRLLSKKDM